MILNIALPIIVTFATLFVTELLKKKHSNESFKFVKLHEKRLDVLEQTFKYLNLSLRLLRQYTQPFKFVEEGKTFIEQERELSINYRNTHNEFLNYFQDNVLYFPEPLEKIITSYFAECGEIFNIYDLKLQMTDEYTKPDRNIQFDAAFVHKKIPEKIDPIKKEIIKEFRNILGEKKRKWPIL
ncbi:hypothetical protein [Flavobacterium sp. 1355]|uniref:hypothetical protein n=1 Tax=Flavobacterium sp. 1355 TaxID=2806571 RepID=UPI001AE9EBA8|nr:hypothetical protein [Flavobacterium sp. 1355]MBP1222635.1 hypothetical protein [Flavobacterium sp. 1355]